MKARDKTKERLLEGHREIRTARQLYMALGILSLVIASTVMYSVSVGVRVETVYVPQVHASMETKIEAVLAHLWFEESFTSDRPDMTLAWEHMDRSEWYARAMLQGGRSDEGTFVALDDPEHRREVGQLLELLARFREIAQARVVLGSSDAGIGSDLDQEFDAVFEGFLAQAAEVESHLQQHIRAEFSRFKITQGALIGACVGFALLVAVLFRRLRRREALALKAALLSEERLKLSLEAGQMASWVWDVRSDSVNGDRRWEQLFGRGPGVMKTVDDLLAALQVQPREQRGDMCLRGVEGDVEAIRDLAIREVTRDEACDLQLPLGQLRQTIRRSRAHPCSSPLFRGVARSSRRSRGLSSPGLCGAAQSPRTCHAATSPLAARRSCRRGRSPVPR